MSPTLILVAGPNGAGKSTLYQTRIAPAFAGPFINADIIQREELGDASPEASYAAAKIAAERRRAILSKGGDFATETVFSHPSKLDLVAEARARGYSVWVMHVGLDSPDLSVARVAHRVEIGGHSVPEAKIRERYDRSAPLIREAVRLSDTGLVYDNSIAGQPPKLILTFERGLLTQVRPNPPRWIRQTYAVDLARIEHAIQRMPGDLVEKATSSTSDHGAAVSIAVDPGKAERPRGADQLAGALSKSIEHSDRLLQMAGEMLPSSKVENLLGISRKEINKRRKSNKILGLKLASDWLYPAFQFSQGEVIRGFDLVLAAHAESDPWIVLEILVTPDDAWSGRTVLNLLEEQDEPSLSRFLRQAHGDGF